MLPVKQIILTYAELASILGFKLPKSAYTYTMWLNLKGHPHCNAWLQAGYNVADVIEMLQIQIITFNCV